jgi:hypothetical protein
MLLQFGVVGRGSNENPPGQHRLKFLSLNKLRIELGLGGFRSVSKVLALTLNSNPATRRVQELHKNVNTMLRLASATVLRSQGVFED